jgi:3-hydroxyisobutyrate dehydrogenase-like beta-hydroxyacid dehydrogenase
MSDVTVIGLGAMGSAIAGAFLHAGLPTTVWNRSAEKMQPLAAAGAHAAADLGAAIEASPVIVVCIDDYTATNKLLDLQGVDTALAGRTLVQFSTGTPGEARGAEAAFTRLGAQYLDGAILAYPREIGHDALVTVSGPEQLFTDCRELLAALSSDVRYLGGAIGGAAALDVAVMSYYILTHLGLVHAGLICESEGVSRDLLAGVLVDSLPSDVEEIAHLGNALQNDAFESPGASIDVYSNILDRILSQARDRNISSRIPDFANSIYKEGVDAGFGDQEVVALIKLLRR